MVWGSCGVRVVPAEDRVEGVKVCCGQVAKVHGHGGKREAVAVVTAWNTAHMARSDNPARCGHACWKAPDPVRSLQLSQQ